MQPKDANDLYWQIHEPKEEAVRSYAEFLYFGALEHKPEIDGIIQKFSEHWRLERMAVVDRNILRLAVFEFLYETETPTTVVINEALEIARKFSTEESTQFINGILDAINKNYLPTVKP
jgi:N utilization substance protein B